jgi:Spy/CpxP family protein refolding chaperone
MKTKLMVVASVMALLLYGATIFAYAQGPGPDGKAFLGGAGHGHGMGYLARELNLTDGQKAEIKTIMQGNHASMKTVMQQLAQNRAALLAAAANGAYDPVKIQSLATQQAQLEAAMIVNRESIKHQIYTKVLTADQQAKAEQLRTQEINRINEYLQKMSTSTDAPPSSNQ